AARTHLRPRQCAPPDRPGTRGQPRPPRLVEFVGARRGDRDQADSGASPRQVRRVTPARPTARPRPRDWSRNLSHLATLPREPARSADTSSWLSPVVAASRQRSSESHYMDTRAFRPAETSNFPVLARIKPPVSKGEREEDAFVLLEKMRTQTPRNAT